MLPPDKKEKSYLFRVKRDGLKAEPVLGDRGDMAATRDRSSPDGKRVLFEGVEADPKEKPVKVRLLIAEIGTAKRWPISQEQNAEIMGFCWSPDGKRVAYAWRQVPAAGAQQETESFLVVADVDGKNPRVVAVGEGRQRRYYHAGGRGLAMTGLARRPFHPQTARSGNSA